MAGLATQETQTTYDFEAIEHGDSTERKSFDLLASVRLLRYDIRTFDQVLPETRDRVYDEMLSLLVEGIDRASRTPFTIQRDKDGQLVYFDQGKWKPYIGMLLTGLGVAKAEASQDFRTHFKIGWAEKDLEKGFAMQSLKPGQTLSWHNSYPHHIEEQYGKDFVNQAGLNASRRLGFLYQAVGNQDGSVSLYSQTVDRSDPKAFAAVEAMLEYDPTADLDTMVRTYDGVLAREYGGEFYTGRRNASELENAWDELLQHKNLIEYFLYGIEDLAKQDLDPEHLEDSVKELTYGVWAALKYRIEDSGWRGDNVSFDQPDSAADFYQLAHEVEASFQRAQDAHEEFIACGGSISIGKSESSLLSLTSSSVFDAIFGEGAQSLIGNNSETNYKFDKRMYCVVCQAPPTKTEQSVEAKKMCGPCGICKSCDTKIRAKSQSDFTLAT